MIGVYPFQRQYNMASVKLLACGSADAIDDEWWSETAGRKRKSAEGLGSRGERRKKSKTEDAETEMEESFATLHTALRQRQEFLQALEQTAPSSESSRISLKETHFVEWSQDDEDTPTFATFLEKVCPHWKRCVKLVKDNGSPLLVVLALSAVRALELRKQLSQFTGGSCTIAKLFAKHMKIQEQSVFLAAHITPIAIATPARLKQLLDTGAVSAAEVKWVVVDWYWRDQKLRRFSDVPEVWDSFVGLYHSHLHPLIRKKLTKLTLF